MKRNHKHLSSPEVTEGLSATTEIHQDSSNHHNTTISITSTTNTDTGGQTISVHDNIITDTSSSINNNTNDVSTSHSSSSSSRTTTSHHKTSSSTKDTSSSSSNLIKTDFPLLENKRIYSRTEIVHLLQHYLPAGTNMEEEVVDLINVLTSEFFSYLYSETCAIADIQYKQNNNTTNNNSNPSIPIKKDNNDDDDMDHIESIPILVQTPNRNNPNKSSSSSSSSTNKHSTISPSTPSTTIDTTINKPIIQNMDIEKALDTLGFHSIAEVLRVWYAQQTILSSSTSTNP